MAFERNDIVNKNRLMGELGEELMGYEHNDIVTVDVMNKAIAEGGGGGYQYLEIPVTHVLPNGKTLRSYAYSIEIMDGEEYQGQINANDAPDVDMATIILDGASSILIKSADSTDGDWLRASDVSVTGNITVDPDNNRHIIVSGEGTVTITWAVGK